MGYSFNKRALSAAVRNALLAASALAVVVPAASVQAGPLSLSLIHI